MVFVFGHMGIGRAITGPWRRALPILPFLFGALLPDLVDKSLYYAHISSYVSCTRTFGHSGLFLAAVAAGAWARRSRPLVAIAIGVATHGVLDFSMDMLSPQPSATLTALTWPFWKTHFASYDFRSPLDQLRQNWKPQILVTEAIGMIVLAREYRRWRRQD